MGCPTVLLGYPSFYSASVMFTEMQTDVFYAVITKNTVSLLQRTRNGSKSILIDEWSPGRRAGFY